MATEEIDIWSDPEARAFVRAHADGTETVPTVDVAGTVLVNPSARRVVALAADAGIADRPARRPSVVVAPGLTRRRPGTADSTGSLTAGSGSPA